MSAASLARQATLVAALRNPACFPHPVRQIEVIETHISWVILTGDYAYKIKKAVELLFERKVADVRVARMHGKVKRQGRYAGKRPDWKKAFVVLKKGEKMVEFFDQA